MTAGQKTVTNVLEGVAERVVDSVLLLIFLNLQTPSLNTYKSRKNAEAAEEGLASVNYQSIKRSLRYLKQKGFVQAAKEANTLPKITQNGLERVKKLMPFYFNKRDWDENIYLITYDLPVKENKARDRLRDYLKKIGCGMLQKSVWVTPYNPTQLVKTFVNEQGLEDELILVSAIGRNGTVGGMNFSELLEKVFCLNKLNQRYLNFIQQVKEGILTSDQVVLVFLSILKNDPQSPFDLLPKGWVGGEAYQLVKNKFNLSEYVTK